MSTEKQVMVHCTYCKSSFIGEGDDPTREALDSLREHTYRHHLSAMRHEDEMQAGWDGEDK